MHNSLKGWTLYNLSDREVQLVIKTLTKNETRLIQVCHQSTLNWEPLDEHRHKGLFVEVGQNHGVFPEPKEALIADDTDTDYFVIRPKKVFLPRLHDRIEKKFPAIVLGQSQNFETETADLSAGGVQFKDLLPKWVSGYFLIKIHDGAETFMLMCSLVEDQIENKRVQIVSEESDLNYVKYKNWLERIR
ncbi:MAG: hypothetical protein ACK4VO_10900 [Pseudobdellovibrio sp.]